MKYFWVSAYCDYGDWEFEVLVETKEEVEAKVKDYFDPEPPKGFGIAEINGPFFTSTDSVICTKQPG